MLPIGGQHVSPTSPQWTQVSEGSLPLQTVSDLEQATLPGPSVAPPWATPLTDLPAAAHAAGTDPESAGREPTGVAVGHAAAVETATARCARASGAARLTRTTAGEADVIQSVGPADRVGRALRRGRTAAVAGRAAARAGGVGGAGAIAAVGRADGAGVGSDAARLVSQHTWPGPPHGAQTYDRSQASDGSAHVPFAQHGRPARPHVGPSGTDPSGFAPLPAVAPLPALAPLPVLPALPAPLPALPIAPAPAEPTIVPVPPSP
jgi:hypothetical protein